MSDPEFIDTNILLYAKIDDGTDKHNHAADDFRWAAMSH
jgi:predicted nucleic acid-binding protein